MRQELHSGASSLFRLTELDADVVFASDGLVALEILGSKVALDIVDDLREGHCVEVALEGGKVEDAIPSIDVNRDKKVLTVLSHCRPSKERVRKEEKEKHRGICTEMYVCDWVGFPGGALGVSGRLLTHELGEEKVGSYTHAQQP